MKENELQLGRERSLATLPDKAYTSLVFRFNCLRSFPLTEIEILEWARILQNANVPVEALEFVLLKMQTCDMDYNAQEGIRNIFKNLKLIKKTDKGYEILKAIW